MKTGTLLKTSCAFALGVLLTSVFPLVQNFDGKTLGILMICNGVLFLCLLILKARKRALVILIIFLCFLGIFHTQNRFEQVKSSPLYELTGEHVEREGTIVGDIDRRQTNTRFILETYDSSGKALITTNRFTNYETGNVVRVSGKLATPRNFETDTGREFDYQMYLLKDGVTHQMYQPSIEILDEGERSLQRGLFRMKQKLISHTEKYVAYPEAGLLGGILYGEKGGLSRSMQDTFREVGIIHIVVLSGYNVTIIAVFMMRLFSRISRRWGLMLSMLGIVAFVLLTGAGPTIVRAGIMALLALIASYHGRDASITRSLVLAGIIMIAINPLVLVYDISFQLSFLATIGLVYFGPSIRKLITWVPTKFSLRENLEATIATQIFVLPLLMYTTGQVSVVAIVVNLIVLPLIPAAMLLGFGTSLLSMIAGPAAWVLAIPDYALLWVIIKIAEVFAHIPFASLTLPEIPIWAVLGCYGLFFVIIWRQSKPTLTDTPDPGHTQT